MKDSNATGKGSQKSSANGSRGASGGGGGGGGGGMVANSSAKGKKGHSGMYHDIVSSLFNISSAAELEEIFLTAARDGDFAKIETLLKRRNEVIFSIDCRDKTTGNTAVIWAAKRGHVKIVELLLRYGADITLRNYDEQTAFEVASPQTRHLLIESADKGGPHRNLLQAAWQGNAKLVKKILAENTVDINVKNADGLTPLLLVTRDVQLFDKLGDRLLKGYNPIEVCKNLLTHRADSNAADEKGKTALHYVATTKAGKAANLVDLLLHEGCEIDAQDSRYFAPIHCASQSGNVEVLVALLDGGSDANTRGFAGATPLHISALNGNDQVACKLLEYGADVTLVDDSGLTPVDVAKTKRVRNTLKQAWTDATQKKVGNNLGPVRHPTEGAANRSPSPKRKKGGEVIFDSIAALSDLYKRRKDKDMSLQNTSATSVESLTPRRSSTIYTLEKIISNQEKSRLAEAHMMKDLSEGRAGISSRGTSRTPVANTPRKLTPIKMASPRKKSTPQPTSRVGSAKHGYLKKCQSDPSRYGSGRSQECQIPVTVLGLDLDDQLQEVKVKKVVQGPSGTGFPARKGHSRNHSDPFTSSSTHSMADSDDLSYYAQGRASKASVITIAEEYWEEGELSESPPQSRLNPLLRTPSASNRDRLNIPDTIQEGKVSKKPPYILDLDQMQVTNNNRSPVVVDGMLYPNSRKVIPPTPTYLTEVFEEDLQESSDFSGGSKDSSPRTDEDISMDVGNLTRTRSILKEGNFNIQASRVRKSDDSGVHEGEKTPSSKSSSVSSSVSNLSGEESQTVTESTDAKAQGKTLKVPSTSVKVIQPTSTAQTGSPIKKANATTTNAKANSEQSAKLRAAAGETAAHRAEMKQTEQTSAQGQARSSSDNAQGVAKPASGSHGGKGAAQTNAVSSAAGNTSSSGPPALPPKSTVVQKSGSNKTKATPRGQRPQQPPPVPPKPSAAVKDLRKSVDLSTSEDIASASGANSNDANSSQANSKPSATNNTKPASERTALPMSKVNSTVLSNHRGAQATPRSNVSKNPPQVASARPGTTSAKPGSATSTVSARSNASASKPKTAQKPNQTSATSGGTVSVEKNTTVIKIMAPGSAPKSEALPTGSKSQTVSSATSQKPATKPKPNVANKIGKAMTAQSIDLAKPRTPPPTGRPPPPLPPKTGASTNNLVSSSEKPVNQSDDTPVAPPRRKRSTPGSDGSANNSPALPRSALAGATSSNLSKTSPASISTTPTVRPVSLAVVSTPAAVKHSPTSPVKTTTASLQTSTIATVSRSGITPVTSACNYSGAQTPAAASPGDSPEAVVKVRQISVKPATSAEETPSKETPEKAVNNNNNVRKGPINHNGPQITDAFESLRKEQEKQVRAMMGGGRRESDAGKSTSVKPQGKGAPVPRSAIKPRNVGMPIPSAVGKRKASGQVRQGSAGKKKGKGKNKVSSGLVQENDDVIVKNRPKSGKKVKKKGKGTGKAGPSFRDKIVLLDKTDVGNRTYISGIGWQIETECDDKSDVHAVVMKFDESDSDEDGETPRVRPNYLDDLENNPATSRSTARAEKKKLRDIKLPGQLPISDGSEVDEDIEEESDPEAEVIEDEVEFFTGPMPRDEYDDEGHSVRSGADKLHYNSMMEEEERLRAENSAQVVSNVIPQTVKAIFDFSKTVTNDDLDNMLGVQEAKKAVANLNKTPTGSNHVGLKSSKSSDAVTKGVNVKSSVKSSEAKQSANSKAKVGSGGAGRGGAGGGTIPKSASEPKINSSRKTSPRSAKTSVSAQQNAKLTTTVEEKPKTNPTQGTKDTLNNNTAKGEETKTKSSESKPEDSAKSSEKKVAEGAKNVKTAVNPHAPRTKQREEAEINEIINEILKSTPDPSLSLSFVSKKKKSNDGGGSNNAKSMTKEDLAKSLRKSIEHGAFKQLRNSHADEDMAANSVHRSLNRSVDSSLGDLLAKVSLADAADASNEFEVLANKHRDLKKRVSAAMMDGLVSPTGNISPNKPQTVAAKPPPAPKNMLQKNLDMEEVRPEKSPRFVRKHHEDSLKGNNHGLRRELGESGNLSEYGSVDLPRSLADDSLTQIDRGEVVTSRLGGRRGSICSRPGSSMTDSTNDDVETIQWKRGNMLGKGAYGTVWCGLTNAGELIAVKQIELNLDNMDKAEEEYEKIQEEVELLKTLQHKNIVGYLGTSLEENYVVNIFMQFVPGGSIANLLARFGSLEEEVFCRYTEQILEGVEYLHSNDVIHRDIKGGNIMLMPTGVIKLIDFGCAKRIALNVSGGNTTSERHSRILKSMRGTPYWMAPEVVNETGHGTKSDIWSIGCTIFEMATRKPPWADVAPMAAIFVIGSESKPIPQLPDKFTTNAREFVNACLTRNPGKRPSAPTLLNHPFISKRRKKTGSFS